MSTLNPGYYNNTSCAPGSVEMPDSTQVPVTLTPVCNPIDKQLINTIISYLISNDIFILNQQTDTQQTPGQFNIYSYGKATSFLSKWFYLLDGTGVSNQTLTDANHTINSLGQYYGPKWLTTDNYTIVADNILLDGQPVLRTDLPSRQTDIILTVDLNGIVNEVPQGSIKTMTPTLQEVTDVGNGTTNTIVQQNATTDYELVPYGQMVTAIADLLLMTPEIIDIIINYLDTHDFAGYVPIAEKATQGGVQTLGLDGKIPFNQIPQLTLQQICASGAITNTTIQAADAELTTELVTLGQLQALISSSVGTLDQVLTQGNTTGQSILFSDANYGNTLQSNEINLTYTNGTQDELLNLTSAGINFIYINTGVNSNVLLKTSISGVQDRLVVNANAIDHYLLTTQDVGHNPASTISIDQDKLDSYHASSFLLKTEFPIDLTGQISGNALVYNGVNWVPGTISGGSPQLVYFAESAVSTLATWSTINSTHSTFFKSNLNKNLTLGYSTGTNSGINNFLVSMGATGPTIAGSSNAVFATSGVISGSNNVVFGDATISTQSTYNFVVNSPSQIGTSTAVSNSMIFNTTTNGSSVYQLIGTYNTLLQNINNVYTTNNTLNYSFLQNNNSLSIGQSDLIALKTDTTTINGHKSTAINAWNCTLTGQRSFVNGNYITTNSYANVAFGTFSTQEVGGTTNSTVDRDRQFFIGSGTSLGSLRNAITVWKSGATQIQGALQLGVTDTNETGSPIVGMIRNNSGYLEIYRGGSWQTQVSTYAGTITVPRWSLIDYLGSSTSPVTHSISSQSDLLNADYMIYPGSNVTTDLEQLTISSGLMTFVANGVYDVAFDIQLRVTSCSLGDIYKVRIFKTDSGLVPAASRALIRELSHTTTQATDLQNLHTNISNIFSAGDMLEIYIYYESSGPTHTVTSITSGTCVTAKELANVPWPA